MNWTFKVVTTTLTMFFLIIVLVNIAFAFGLTTEIPFDMGNTHGISFYQDKYFGFSTLLDSFKTYFSDNKFLTMFESFLRIIRVVMSKVSFANLSQSTIDNIANMFSTFGADVTNPFIGGVVDFLEAFVTVFTHLFNLFCNVPYIVMAVVFFFLYLVYVTSIAITFILYILTLVCGGYYSTYPDYPSTDINPFIIEPNPNWYFIV